MKSAKSEQPLAPLTTLGVGGRARFYHVVNDLPDLRGALERSRMEGLLTWVLSGGSNIVVADVGITGLVLDIQLTGIRFEPGAVGRVRATVAAGEDWDGFVSEAVRRGYSGVECLSGIPGRVGATPIQNVGAYGQDVSQSIESLDVLDRSTGDLLRFEASECAFGYRTSRFKHADADRYVIVSVTFSLSEGPPPIPSHRELQQQLGSIAHPSVQELRDVVLKLRRAKSMVADESDPCARSCGSFFVNPVVPESIADAIRERHASDRVPAYPQPPKHAKIAAAWLIEKSGFERGYQQGRVGISDKHSLAIVARPGATAAEVVRLARSIQNRVHECFGIWLAPEPNFWGFEGTERGLPILD